MTQPTRRLLGTQFIKWTEVGQTYEGTLESREPIKFGDRDTHKYTFANSDGKVKMNGTDQLDDALSEAALGSMIEIKYLGETKTQNGFDVKQFEVAEITLGGHSAK